MISYKQGKNREDKIFKAFIAYSQASLINLFFLIPDVIYILLLQFLILLRTVEWVLISDKILA